MIKLNKGIFVVDSQIKIHSDQNLRNYYLLFYSVLAIIAGFYGIFHSKIIILSFLLLSVGGSILEIFSYLIYKLDEKLNFHGALLGGSILFLFPEKSLFFQFYFLIILGFVHFFIFEIYCKNLFPSLIFVGIMYLFIQKINVVSTQTSDYFILFLSQYMFLPFHNPDYLFDISQSNWYDLHVINFFTHLSWKHIYFILNFALFNNIALYIVSCAWLIFGVLRSRIYLLLLFLGTAIVGVTLITWYFKMDAIDYWRNILQLLIFSQVPMILFLTGYFSVYLNYSRLAILYAIGGFVFGSIGILNQLNIFFGIIGVIYLISNAWLWRRWGKNI